MNKLKNNRKIYYKLWNEVNGPKVCLQIFHGMVEHINRYDDFARFMNASGIIVVGMDVRGHGRTGIANGQLGLFSNDDGWNKVIDDQHSLHLEMKQLYPDLTHVLLGHSMGSFFARDYINTYPNNFSKVVIMGTGKADSISYKFASSMLHFMDDKKQARLMDKLAFGGYSKAVKSANTSYDWLSHDHLEVKKYIEDPLCGFMVKNSFYKDFMYGMKKIAKLEKDISYKSSILFISGEEDPVGNFGKSVKETYVSYNNIAESQLILYPKMRHEILNEIDKQRVYQDILNYIK